MSDELYKEHRNMVTDLAKDGLDIVNELTGKKAHLWHMGTGMSGEVAELLEAVYDVDVPDGNHIVEELGDFEFFVEGARQELEIERYTTVSPDTEDHTITMENRYYAEKMLVNLAVASGMFLDLVKKHVVYNKDVDIEAFREALKKVEYYAEGFRQGCIISREETLKHNLHKLLKGDKARYKSGSFSNEQAQERADKQ